MAMIFRYTFFILLLSFIPINAQAIQGDLADLHVNEKTPYQEGLERIEMGDIETALDYWFHLSRK